MVVAGGGVPGGGGLPTANRKPINNGEEDLEAAIGVGLGELAEITVSNDADPSNYDVRLATFNTYVYSC